MQRCSSSIQAYSEAINRKAPEDGPVSRKVALTDREVVSSQREPAVRASAGGRFTNVEHYATADWSVVFLATAMITDTNLNIYEN